MIEILPETPALHADAIEALYDRTFGPGHFAKTAERLREGNASVPDVTRVAVSDGIVAVNPEAEDVRVPAGEAVEKARGSDTLIRTQIDPALVASWRDGRLEFDDTPITAALAQLKRSTGVAITAAPRFANARLTGSVAIEAEPQEIARRFAAIVGGTARPLNDAETRGWVIE